MKSMADEEVIRRLQSVEEREREVALRYLYERVQKTVRRYILKNKGNEQDVDDYFHEGIIAFYQLVRRGKLASDTKVEAYLFTICRNMWNKKLKKQMAQVALDDKQVPISEEDLQLKTLLSKERKDLIQDLLRSLGPDCQQLLIHFYFDRLRMKEIVQKMNFSSEQVAKNKKSTCMKKLRGIVLASPFYNNLLK